MSSSTSDSGDDDPAEKPATSHEVKTLWRTAFDAFFLVDDDRRYVHVNESASALLGAPVQDLLKRRIGDFTPPALRPALERIWADFERHGAMQGGFEVVRGDSSHVLIEYRGTRNFGPGRHVIAVRPVNAAQRDIARSDLAMQRNAPSLSPREREVLQLAARGHSTRKIAEILRLSPATIKTHFEHAYDKLGARDRVSAVAECLRRGLIE